jgi:hypothetical protein
MQVLVKNVSRFRVENLPRRPQLAVESTSDLLNHQSKRAWTTGAMLI